MTEILAEGNVIESESDALAKPIVIAVAKSHLIDVTSHVTAVEAVATAATEEAVATVVAMVTEATRIETNPNGVSPCLLPPLDAEVADHPVTTTIRPVVIPVPPLVPPKPTMATTASMMRR